MLLEADAPVCEKDNNENEPIHLAAKAGSKDIISLLKDFGGIVYNPGKAFAQWLAAFFWFVAINLPASYIVH